MLLKYHFSDLEKAGLGSRNTIKAKIERGEFPAPLVDSDGRPVWTGEVIQEYMDNWKKSLRTYSPVTPSHLQAA